MTERERQRRERQRQASYTLSEWCERRRISRAMFYVLEKKKRAPRTHHAGRKVLISDEADAEWLHAREAEAAAPNPHQRKHRSA